MKHKKKIFPLKRRIKGKTDYYARIALLKSQKPRLVIRKSNKYILGQIVISRDSQDYLVTSAFSKELSKYGWNYGFNNCCAAYLTGFLLGNKLTNKRLNNINEVIVDIGLHRSTKGSKIYCLVKGIEDSGITISYNSEMINEKRILGEHLKEKYKDIDKKIEEVKQKIKKELEK